MSYVRQPTEALPVLVPDRAGNPTTPPRLLCLQLPTSIPSFLLFQLLRLIQHI
jgi:hypothetical protein